MPGFHLFWWRLMSLGLLARSRLQVWSHAHSVGEKRLSKISMFILLYWRHKVSRWVFDMWYQPRRKQWELMALNTYRDWLLHLCRWCLTHVSEVYLLQMTVSTPSPAQHSSRVVQVPSELHALGFPHHRLDIPMHTHIGCNFSAQLCFCLSSVTEERPEPIRSRSGYALWHFCDVGIISHSSSTEWNQPRGFKLFPCSQG